MQFESVNAAGCKTRTPHPWKRKSLVFLEGKGELKSNTVVFLLRGGQTCSGNGGDDLG